MKIAVIFILLAPGSSLQHRHSNSGSSEIEDSSGQTQEYEYKHSPYSYRSSKKHKHKKSDDQHPGSAELEASNNKYIRHSDKHSHRSSKKHHKDINCDSNETDQPEPIQVEQPGINPGNLVFVPYPYPLVVPPPVPAMELIPSTSITTSTAPYTNDETTCVSRRNVEIVNRENYLDLLRSLKLKHELTYVRDDSANIRPVRRYILDRLLSRVRNVKDINSV